MAALKEDSSKRRRSIAVLNRTKKNSAQSGRRRAYSIAPGEHLNDLDKSRRPLFAPRKSILKSSVLVNTDDAFEQLSQPSNSQSLQLDDENITQSMDLTLDYHAKLHDNTSRKSLGRRVSFAEHAHVRLFQIPNQDNTNSTGSPQSSPVPSSSPEANLQPTLSNENDYPASFSRTKRGSVRPSFAGSEDMDLTTASPGIILNDEDSVLMDEEMNLDENVDMEVTEVLQGGLLRRRSSAVRQPFAPVRPRDSIIFPSDDAVPSDDDDNQNNEDSQVSSMLQDDNSQMHSVENSQEGMEFTVPMGQSLRPPATEDPVWLALRRMTHSGDTPHEPEAFSEDDIQVDRTQQGMDLNDAMARLIRVRDSLDADATDISGDMDVTNFAMHEDSLSTDVSIDDDMVDGNETLDVSKIVKRMSLGDGRMSLGHQDSTMDESGIYGSLQPLPLATLSQNSMPTIRALDEVDTMSGQAALNPLPEETTMLFTSAAVQEQTQITPAFTFVPPIVAPAVSRTSTKPASPVKPKHTFSAAFAPPVAKPSPRKFTPSFTPEHGTLNKRSFSVMQDGVHDSGRPSPTKRPTIDQRPLEHPSSGTSHGVSTALQTRMSLSPSKKTESKNSFPKRPSGYFARRKSLGNALGASQNNQRSGNSTGSLVSPGKQTGNGRMSLGSVPSAAWVRSDKIVPRQPTVVPPAEDTQTPQEQEHTSPRIPDPARASSPPIVAEAASNETPEQVNGEQVSVEQSNVEHAYLGRHQADNDMTQEHSPPQGEIQPDDDIPSISIQKFFALTGIRFMDELTAPRRSIHPGFGNRQARNPADIPLTEYYIAMGIDVPQLGLFTRVSKDLEGWITRSKAEFVQAEEEAAKITPELFTEFTRADEEGQAELLHHLNLIRSNARGQAKSDWYDWKLRWVEGLQLTAEQVFNDLQDAKMLEPVKKSTEELLPTLEKEYIDILKELEHEQEEVRQIEASDQGYLNDLKVSIAEQNIEVESQRAELYEQTEQLNHLQGRLQELAIEKKVAMDVISKARPQHVLLTEVFRLRDELDTLEDLHRFRIIKVDESMIEYIYASCFRVSIPCNHHLPIASGVEIAQVDGLASRTKDDFPKLSKLFLKAAKAFIHRTQPVSCAEVISYLSDYWSSCSQLRAQILLLAVRYPVDISLIDCDGLPGFKARTKVMIPSKKAKFFATFNFTPDIFSRWPLSIGLLTCDVEVAYGPVSQSEISQALSERFSQATPSDNYACLLDACIEAQEVYNQERQ